MFKMMAVDVHAIGNRGVGKSIIANFMTGMATNSNFSLLVKYSHSGETEEDIDGYCQELPMQTMTNYYKKHPSLIVKR